MKSDRWFYLAVAVVVLAAWMMRYEVVVRERGGAMVQNRFTGSYHWVVVDTGPKILRFNESSE